MITCFLPVAETGVLDQTVSELRQVKIVSEIFVMLTGDEQDDVDLPEGVNSFRVSSIHSTRAVREMLKRTSEDGHILLYTKSMMLKPGLFALERMEQVSRLTGAGIIYSDYYVFGDGKIKENPVIDFQEGSLRDDFEFGAVLLIRCSAFAMAVDKMTVDYEYAGLYDLRLKISQEFRVVRLPEFSYTVMERDTRQSGEKIFDYVDPKNREVQLEMELACTQHLKDIGGWLKPEFRELNFTEDGFAVEASVIIPVRNRVKTIEDAVISALAQKATFDFNVIIVDNHSNDGTTEILKKLGQTDNRVIHVIPGRNDLGIGGCWNIGIMHEQCGKFAVQLDSDDLFPDTDALQLLVDAFYQQNCAMVIGSYQMVNFNLEEIPPGIIDHKEWTPDNGRNNALRINGLGAPRAFFTPVIREIKFSNVSYGEDYCVGLAISREYRIGRVFRPLYLCRRWADNSDASLDVIKMNRYNTYKDRLRTIELWARIAKNKS
jgi:hypothetical protein